MFGYFSISLTIIFISLQQSTFLHPPSTSPSLPNKSPCLPNPSPTTSRFVFSSSFVAYFFSIHCPSRSESSFFPLLLCETQFVFLLSIKIVIIKTTNPSFSSQYLTRSFQMKSSSSPIHWWIPIRSTFVFSTMTARVNEFHIVGGNHLLWIYHFGTTIDEIRCQTNVHVKISITVIISLFFFYKFFSLPQRNFYITIYIFVKFSSSLSHRQISKLVLPIYSHNFHSTFFQTYLQ